MLDAPVMQALKQAGYQHIVIDGGWRDDRLDPQGLLAPHLKRFPAGMADLAAKIHQKGFKLGLHLAVGTHDCGGDLVGSFGREQQHLAQLLSWGVDYIKLARCLYHGVEVWPRGLAKQVYETWYRLV